MKIKYEPTLSEKTFGSKKSVHISISPTKYRVFRAHLSLHDISMQAYFEEICGLVCEENDYLLKIMKDLQDRKRFKSTKKLYKEEQDDIYDFIKENSDLD